MTALDDPGPAGETSDEGVGVTADFLVAGLPGPLLRWTCDLVAQAMARTYPSVAHLPIGERPRWMPPDPAVDAQARLFFGDFVSEAWAAAVLAGRLPAVLVIEDAAWSWDHLCRAGQSPAEAIRDLVAIATTLGDLAGQDGVLTLPRAAWADPAAVAARILAHLGLADAADGNLAGIAAGDDGEPAWEVPVQHMMPAERQALIEAVVVPACVYAGSGVRVPVTWPRECLFWGDQLGEPVPRVLDLTGPARVVAYGPYYALPRGTWTMRVTLAFAPTSCGAPLVLELHGAGVRGRFEFTVAQPGVFAASFQVLLPSSCEPLEARLVTARGAIEGSVGLDRIEFVPAPG